MRLSLTLRRSIAAVSLPLMLGGLAACGSDDEASPAAAESSAAESQDSSAPEEGGEVDTAAFVDDLKAGLEASTTAKMSMHMDVAGQAIHGDGDIDYTTDPPQMAMSMESPAMGEQPIDIRLVDNVMYVNMGQMSNDKFIKFDLSDPQSLPPGMDQVTEMMDPLAATESLGKGLTSVVFVGDEDVDGETLSHYEVAVDPSKIEQFQQLPGQAQAEVPETLAYDLWLDDENRMRKLDMTMDVGDSGEMAMEMELRDWDEPVDIAAPPAGDVVDPSKLAG